MSWDCHSGQNLVFTIGDVEFYAGGRNRSGGWQKAPVPIELAMGPSETLSLAGSGTVVPKGWKCEGELPKPPKFISFDWPDFSIPDVEQSFWLALRDDIVENKITTVSCQCAGGHGRTGVQLSILAYLLSDKPQWETAEELILWVREKHCDHAVENKGQQQYVADVCGIEMGASVIKPKPIHIPKSYNGFGQAPTLTNYTEISSDKEYKGLLADRPKAFCEQCDEIWELTDDDLDEAEFLICHVCHSDLELEPTKPPKKNKGKGKKKPTCIVCEEGEIDAKGCCITCGIDNIAWDSDLDDMPENLCINCGHNTIDRMMVDSFCSMCHAEKLDMKVNHDGSIKCNKCKAFKHGWQFFYDDKNSKNCLRCTHHNIKSKSKGKSKSSKKQKDLTEYLI
jgi:hypothetical protein